MADITAQAVKSLRDKTQLPMMECKKALQETGGDEEKAIEWLRKQGKSKMMARQDRETAAGYIAVYASLDNKVGAMVELLCESAPVAANDEFRQLANDLAEQLATGEGAASGEELLKQTSPSKGGPLQDQFDDLTNRIREVFKVARLLRIGAPCGGYAHHTGTDGVLVEVEGGDQVSANEVAMHVAAMKPEVVNKEDLDAAAVAKEREILTEAARKEGKPENIIDKMVDGRMKNFYAEKVLLEQPFVKDEKGKTSVGQFAKTAKMTVKSFVHWKLGKSE